MSATGPALVEAYILYQRPYRETSVIADFVTADDQHVRAVCKGVRGSSRPAMRTRSAMQLFARCTISFSGRTELKSLRQIEALESPAQLTGNLLYSALYVNELTVRLCRADGIASGLYAAYLRILHQLLALEESDPQGRSTGEHGGRVLESVLREFEFSLMRLCGYEIDCLHEAFTGNSVDAQYCYQFDPDNGFVRTASTAVQPKVDLRAIPGSVLLQIAAGKYDQRSVQQFAKLIVREALKPLLAGKPLKSRELFTSL